MGGSNAALTAHSFADLADVRLYYERTGSGDLELLFVPGWWRLSELKPDLEVGITVGAGHFHQLEVPEQVNATIERFLAISL